eukprot:471829_1
MFPILTIYSLLITSKTKSTTRRLTSTDVIINEFEATKWPIDGVGFPHSRHFVINQEQDKCIVEYFADSRKETGKGRFEIYDDTGFALNDRTMTISPIHHNDDNQSEKQIKMRFNTVQEAIRVKEKLKSKKNFLVYNDLITELETCKRDYAQTQRDYAQLEAETRTKISKKDYEHMVSQKDFFRKQWEQEKKATQTANEEKRKIEQIIKPLESKRDKLQETVKQQKQAMSILQNEIGYDIDLVDSMVDTHTNRGIYGIQYMFKGEYHLIVKFNNDVKELLNALNDAREFKNKFPIPSDPPHQWVRKVTDQVMEDRRSYIYATLQQLNAVPSLREHNAFKQFMTPGELETDNVQMTRDRRITDWKLDNVQKLQMTQRITDWKLELAFKNLGIYSEEDKNEQASVEKAFRKKSFKYHPDRHPDDPIATRHFLKLQRSKELIIKSKRWE